MTDQQLPDRDINRIEIDDPWLYGTDPLMIASMQGGKDFLVKRREHEQQLMAEARARAGGSPEQRTP